MVCLWGTVTIRSPGIRCWWCVSSPLGFVRAVVAGRGGLDLADAPVDVEALFAEEQQRRRKSGR